jgi:type I restriction enzyme R subunit
MLLGDGGGPKLSPLTGTGSGMVQKKEKALLTEIIAKVNDLFDGELTEDDKIVYVNNVNSVIKGKLLESPLLVQQASTIARSSLQTRPI